MLQEKDSRILSIAMDALIKDFEPREAVPYMAAKLIFTDDQRDAILIMVGCTCTNIEHPMILHVSRLRASKILSMLKE